MFVNRFHKENITLENIARFWKIPNLYTADTSLQQTLFQEIWVSTIERFDCITQEGITTVVNLTVYECIVYCALPEKMFKSII